MSAEQLIYSETAVIEKILLPCSIPSKGETPKTRSSQESRWGYYRGNCLGKKPLLTSNQIGQLRLSALGSTNLEIAQSKGISRLTVKNTSQLIFQNLNTDNTTQAVLKAIRLGFLDLSDITTEDDRIRYNSLTDREKKVLADIVNLDNTSGNKAISQRLKISSNTVKAHLRNIYIKLGVRSRTQAAVFYLVVNLQQG